MLGSQQAENGLLGAFGFIHDIEKGSPLS